MTHLEIKAKTNFSSLDWLFILKYIKMSNPLISLKKSKKSPLYLPEVYSPPLSSMDRYDMNKSMNSVNSEDSSYKFNLNHGFMSRNASQNSSAINNNKQMNIINYKNNSSSPPRVLLTQRFVNIKSKFHF
jgi:hypothetical protein